MKTFSELCPRWAKKIASGKVAKPSVVDHKRLDIEDDNRCVVGEAYGFTDNYACVRTKRHCSVCMLFSIEMAGVVLQPAAEETIEIVVKRFMTHWQDTHESGAEA